MKSRFAITSFCAFLAAGAFAQDVVSVSTPAGCTFVETPSATIPVTVTDVPGTPLDASNPEGSRITGLLVSLSYPPASISSAQLQPSGVLEALTPRYSRAGAKEGVVTFVASYDDTSNAIPFSGAADEIAALTVTPIRVFATPDTPQVAGQIIRVPIEVSGESILSNLDGTLRETIPATLTGSNGCIATVVDFLDVPATHMFHTFVNRMVWRGITAGCGAGKYCPDAGVSRAQIAVFLLRSKYGESYVPPPATGNLFSDVPASSPFARWIEQLAAEGVTGGCGGGAFCPFAFVTRAQIAVFLLRQKEGPAYSPPPATGIFSDVPVSSPYAPWIEELARRGVTGGCGNGKYCPDSVVTRGQASVFLSVTFGF